MAPHPALSPRCWTGNVNGAGRGIKGEGPCFFHTLRKSLHRVSSSALTGLRRLCLPCPPSFPHSQPMSNPIIVALDVPTAERAWTLAEQLAPVVGAFKVGSELFTSAGPDIVRHIRSTGASLFLDLKFHDIPNTVAKAVAAATRL